MAIATTPDVRSVSTSAGTVRVRDRGGDGPAVLLVHSLLVDPDLYATLGPLLSARGYRCLEPELPLGAHSLALRPGADLSPRGLARLLVEVLDGLGVASTSVVGVDTGGALTQLLMAQHRDRVDRVVLTACDAYEHFPPPSFAWAARLMTWPGVLLLTALASRLRVVRRLAVPRDLRAVVAGMDSGCTLAAAEANRDFPRPVLVAWGDDDRLFRRSLAERLVQDLPDARLVTLPDCAAFAAIDVPELLAELVDEHLQAL